MKMKDNYFKIYKLVPKKKQIKIFSKNNDNANSKFSDITFNKNLDSILALDNAIESRKQNEILKNFDNFSMKRNRKRNILIRKRPE